MVESFFERVHKHDTHTPDVLSCLANLSNDEVFTPPELVNKVLDMLPQELFKDPNTKFLDPATKTGVFLREIAKRLLVGLEPIYPDLQERIDHIFHEQLYGIAITELTSLLARRSLYCSKYPNGKYSICHFDSPDERGIDVAMLYRADMFSVEGCRAIRVNVESAPNLRTRDFLLVWGVMGGEKILFCVVHFPSRIGGVKQTEHLRIGCAEQISEIVDSIAMADADRRIVIMGDMNDNPSDKSIRKVLGAKPVSQLEQVAASGALYNLTSLSRGGSSVYDGRWNRFDNIIVSANLLSSSDGLRVVMPKRGNRGSYVQRLEYLLDDKGHPKATYRGSEYQGGVSDHLPIYMLLER